MLVVSTPPPVAVIVMEDMSKYLFAVETFLLSPDEAAEVASETEKVSPFALFPIVISPLKTCVVPS